MITEFVVMQSCSFGASLISVLRPPFVLRLFTLLQFPWPTLTPTFICFLFWNSCSDSNLFSFFVNFFSQPKPPRCSAKTLRLSSGACRRVPCRACWILTTSAHVTNPLWPPWCTPSRRFQLSCETRVNAPQIFYFQFISHCFKGSTHIEITQICFFVFFYFSDVIIAVIKGKKYLFFF